MSWQTLLFDWYQKSKRDLPWRRTRDPYKIWVSEIMLQQTTVETVIPYYQRFLKRFPTLKSLAQAPEEEVLKLWSGLGYYSRARNLHRAAKYVMKEFGGKVPSSPEELQTLPGVGRYTAGAIASIAFGRRVPVLDGNVIRVLSRLYALAMDPKSVEGRKIFWQKAQGVLPSKNCGDFNQALMELGATLCTPENPLCPLCPVTAFCKAREKGDPEAYPHGKKKTVYEDRILTAAIVERDGKILLVKRPDKGLLKGFWEFPMVEGPPSELVQQWSLQALHPLPLVRHSVLNRRLKITPLVCQMTQEKVLDIPHRWILPSEITDLPTSSMNKKILSRFSSNSPNR